MKFFVKDISTTMQARMLIFGTQVDDDLLYYKIENQPSPVYSSLHLSSFLSFHTLKNEIFRQRFIQFGLFECSSVNMPYTNRATLAGICHRARLEGEQCGEQILPWGSLCERTPLGNVVGEFSSS